MNSYLCSLHRLRFTALMVIVVLTCLPYAILVNNVYIILLLTCLTSVTIITKQSGSSFLIITIASCIPHLVGSDDVVQDFIAQHTKWAYRSVYVLLLLILIIKYKSINLTKYKHLLVYSLSLLLLSSLYGSSDLNHWLYKVLTITGFFFVCKSDDIKWRELYTLFSLFILMHCVYIIAEFILGISPYGYFQQFTSAYMSYGFNNANGIAGNSLFTVGMIAAYQTSILINYVKEGYFHKALFVLTCVTMLMCGSRTGIVLTSLSTLFFVFFVMSNIDKQVKVLASLLLLSLFAIIIASEFYNEEMKLIFGRFSEQSEHREAGYGTVLNIISNHPFGVGIGGMESALNKYATSGFLSWFKTIDNFYLTLIANYGLLSILPFLFFFYIPIRTYHLSKYNKNYRIVVLWMIPFAATGMSFNMDSSILLCLLFYGVCGYLCRIIENKYD